MLLFFTTLIFLFLFLFFFSHKCPMCLNCAAGANSRIKNLRSQHLGISFPNSTSVKIIWWMPNFISCYSCLMITFFGWCGIWIGFWSNHFIWYLNHLGRFMKKTFLVAVKIEYMGVIEWTKCKKVPEFSNTYIFSITVTNSICCKFWNNMNQSISKLSCWVFQWWCSFFST